MTLQPREPLPRDIIWALVGYACVLSLALALGWRMHIPYQFYQFLERSLLEERLGESLLYLHAQPPMLNLVLGMALKLSDILGTSPESILLALHVILGGFSVAGFTWLASFMIEWSGLKWLCIAIYIAHPVFYMSLTLFFYTFHELVYFSVTPFFIIRFLRVGQVKNYAALCALTVALVYTRSLFHFAWALAGLAWVLYCGNRLNRKNIKANMKSLAACYGIALILLLAWPIKNQAIFGTFGYSSWLGYNLSQGLALEDTFDEDAVRIPERFQDIPALSVKYKPDDSPNWNHFSIIENFRVSKDQAIDAMVRDPKLIVRKAASNYWNLTRFTGRHPYYGFYGDDRNVPNGVRAWMRFYEIATHLDFRQESSLKLPHLRPNWPTRVWHISGFFLLLPLLLYKGVRKTIETWKSDPIRSALAATLLGSILWVLLMSLFIDGLEGNRIRFSTEQYLMVLAFWILPTPRDRKSPEQPEKQGD